MPTIKYGTENTVTGNAFLKQQLVTTASVLALPIVKEVNLKSANSAINTARLSGKRKGAMVLMEMADKTLHIAVAKGSEPTDAWSVAALDSVVTPAGQ